MLTVPLVIVGSILAASGIAFAIWSIVDTNRKYGKRKRGVGN